jgi:SAM-dependent methyltransferase
MNLPLAQHQAEIQHNRAAWENKPLLRQAYAAFYRRIIQLIDRRLPGAILEVGSGIGNLKEHFPEALSSDLFPNPWLDLVCDGYELPFRDGSLSHLILFDVFHHLEAPRAFLAEARRSLAAHGRLIVFEPFISFFSWPIYAGLHHEPVAWGQPLRGEVVLPRPRGYYAAQGNATRWFFRQEKPSWIEGWSVFHCEAFAACAYLMSGGFSKPAFLPADWFGALDRLDGCLSRWPRWFGARCLVGLGSTLWKEQTT